MSVSSDHGHLVDHGFPRFLDPATLSKFQDLELMSKAKTFFRVNKVLLISVSQLVRQILMVHQEDLEPVIGTEISDEDLEIIVAFLWSGCIPDQLPKETMASFVSLGINIYEMKFNKSDANIDQDKALVCDKSKSQKCSTVESSSKFAAWFEENDFVKFVSPEKSTESDSKIESACIEVEIKSEFPFREEDRPGSGGPLLDCHDSPEDSEYVEEDSECESDSEANKPRSKSNRLASELFQCSLCSYGTNSSEDYYQHRMGHKAIEKERYEGHAERSPSLKCIHCGVRRRNQAELEKHKRFWGKHHSERCVQCGKDVLSWEEHADHVVDEHAGVWLFNCGICAETFQTKGLTISHRVVHSGSTQSAQVCDICGLAVRRLNDHKKRTHSDVKAFRCELCPKTFCLPGQLRKHRSFHERKFACEHCGKRFPNRQSLEAHTVRIHRPADERPFKCKLCPRSYFERHKLEDHANTHTGQRPHSCKYCPESFFTYHQRLGHEKQHEGGAGGVALAKRERRKYSYERMTCPRCGKSCANEAKLNLHLLNLHTPDEEKPFKCETCAKGFSERAKLREHLNIHSNSRPHKCQFCGKGFNSLGTRNGHERAVHLGEKGSSVKKKVA